MSDSDLRTQGGQSTPGLKEKLAEMGGELKQAASETIAASSETTRDKLGEFTDAAKEVAAHAAEQVQEQVTRQQSVGADYMGRLAENVRGAAKAFEKDSPLASRAINMAAEYVDSTAETMKSGNLSDLVDGATSFAKRQPAAFLGLSVLAGFALVRFLKASEGGASSQSRGSKQGSSL